MRKWFSVIVGLALLASLVPMAAAEPPAPEEVEAATILDCFLWEDDFEDDGLWKVDGFTSNNTWYVQSLAGIDLFGVNAGGCPGAPNDIFDDLVSTVGESLPAARKGTNVAWFGAPITVTHAGLTDTIGSYLDDGTSFKPSESSCKDGGDTQGGDADDSYYGTLALSDTIDLSLADPGVTLNFWSWWEIESVRAETYDLMKVEALVDGGATWDTLLTINDETTDMGIANADVPWTSGGFGVAPVWKKYHVDLTDYRSTTTTIRFSFDTVDGAYNGFRGWVIDELTITDPVFYGVVEDCDTGERRLAGVTVQVEGTDLEATTDANGFYAIYADQELGFACGVYDLIASKDGYWERDVKVDMLDPWSPWKCACSQQVDFVGKDCLDVVPSPLECFVDGIVFDAETGDPIEGATVGIWTVTDTEDPGIEHGAATTDADGYYCMLDGLPAGYYLFRIVAPHYATRHALQQLVSGSSEAAIAQAPNTFQWWLVFTPPVNFVPISAPAGPPATGLEVANLGLTSTWVDIWYYDAAGVNVGMTSHRLNSGSSVTEYPLPTAAATAQSAIVTSYTWKGAPSHPFDRVGYIFGDPIGTTVNRITLPGGAPASSYSAIGIEGLPDDETPLGIPFVGNDTYWIYAPLVMNANNGWNTTIWVQNANFSQGILRPIATASVDMYYYDQNGNMVLAVANQSIPPYASRGFTVPALLPAGWVGSCWIRSDVPITGVADEYRGATLATADMLMSYRMSGKSRIGTGLAAWPWNFGPLIFSSYNGWQSGITVLNTSESTDAKVKIVFRDTDGTPLATRYETLEERSSKVIFPLSAYGLPVDRVGSVSIESEWYWPPGDPWPTLMATTLAVVQQFNDTTGQASAYNALRGTVVPMIPLDAAENVAVPLVFKYHGGTTLDTGWSTGLQIMHADLDPDDMAYVDVNFYDAAGGEVPFFVANLTIPGGTSRTLDLRWLGGNTIPPGFVGSVKCDVTSLIPFDIDPIAVVANEILDLETPTTGDFFMTFEGYPRWFAPW